MSVDRTTFNKAFRIFQEFGPLRRLPRGQRLKSEFPHLSDQDISYLIQSFKKTEEIALSIAERTIAGDFTQQEGAAKLKAECPILSDELIEATFSQAFYFAYK